MTENVPSPYEQQLRAGQVCYVQLPALDVAASEAFYDGLFGWVKESGSGDFEAPGLIGQWVTDRRPATDAGPLLWVIVDSLSTALEKAASLGGRVVGEPMLDHGERWLATVDDCAGNRLGLVEIVRS